MIVAEGTPTPSFRHAFGRNPDFPLDPRQNHSGMTIFGSVLKSYKTAKVQILMAIRPAAQIWPAALRPMVTHGLL
jgi:hypothetical protein